MTYVVQGILGYLKPQLLAVLCQHDPINKPPSSTGGLSVYKSPLYISFVNSTSVKLTKEYNMKY